MTGRLKLAMSLVYISVRWGSQSTWPTLWLASLQYSLSRSVSQPGELPQVCQNCWNIPSHSFQLFSAGMSFVVGRKSEKYRVAVDIDLSAGQSMGDHLDNISLVDSSEK